MSTIAETKIEADPNVPIIRMTREFAGTRALTGAALCSRRDLAGT